MTQARLLITLLLTLSLPATALAAVYKREGPDGQIIYSDQPHPEAEELSIELPPPPPPESASLDNAPEAPDTEQAAPMLGYADVTIVKPENDATVRENAGMVEVELALEPGLNTEQGHKIAVMLDGEQSPATQTSEQFALSNVARGTHTLQVQIISDQGLVIATSNSVIFHLKRVSSILQGQNSPLGAPISTTGPTAPTAPRLTNPALSLPSAP